jgi:hypothetical protein
MFKNNCLGNEKVRRPSSKTCTICSEETPDLFKECGDIVRKKEQDGG